MKNWKVILGMGLGLAAAGWGLSIVSPVPVSRSPEVQSAQEVDPQPIGNSSGNQPSNPEAVVEPESTVDEGNSSDANALEELNRQIEESVRQGELDNAVSLIAQIALVRATTSLREQGSSDGSMYQKFQLAEMESYARTYPVLLQNYDYQMTLLLPALSVEELPLLEKRVQTIRQKFPESFVKDNDCLIYLLAVRKKDPDADSWQAACATSPGELSAYAKSLVQTIQKRN